MRASRAQARNTSFAMGHETRSAERKDRGGRNAETRDRFEAHVRRFPNLPNNVRFRETVTSFYERRSVIRTLTAPLCFTPHTNAWLDAIRCLVRILATAL